MRTTDFSPRCPVKPLSTPPGVPRRGVAGWFAAAVLLMAVIPAFAVDRVVTISAPRSAMSGSPVVVSVAASTDAGDGEQIGFLHAQYSVDGGATWVAISFQEKAGPRTARTITFVAGPGGSRALVRVRVAFRGGKAGDVDYLGNPIVWKQSWDKWGEPPAKGAVIKIEAP